MVPGLRSSWEPLGAVGSRWRGSGAAKRPREPGGSMCLTASRHGRRRIGLGGAASGAGHARSEKHECLGWRRIDSGGAAPGRADHTRADECLVWRRICGGGAACGAGRTRSEKHECLGWRRIGRGGAIAGRAGHTRADECLVWRRICGGAAAGGAGHTRAEKHELPRMAAHLW